MDSSESISNILQSRIMLINGSQAIRLYNGISTRRESVQPTNQQSLMSVCSSNELGYSCRICRWNRNELLIQKCPCECRGSVGYVHLKCLRRWIAHRGDDHCEICGTKFRLAIEKRCFKKMFWSFFQSKYLGAILKNAFCIGTLAPISYLVLYQVLKIMEHIHLKENNNIQIIFLAPALLMASSIAFFYAIEFAISKGIRIKNILKHWWLFGGQETDPLFDSGISNETFEFF